MLLKIRRVTGQFRVPLPMLECTGRINPATLVVELLQKHHNAKAAPNWADCANRPIFGRHKRPMRRVLNFDSRSRTSDQSRPYAEWLFCCEDCLRIVTLLALPPPPPNGSWGKSVASLPFSSPSAPLFSYDGFLSYNLEMIDVFPF